MYHVPVHLESGATMWFDAYEVDVAVDQPPCTV